MKADSLTVRDERREGCRHPVLFANGPSLLHCRSVMSSGIAARLLEPFDFCALLGDLRMCFRRIEAPKLRLSAARNVKLAPQRAQALPTIGEKTSGVS
jgi:hypothetical protein